VTLDDKAKIRLLRAALRQLMDAKSYEDREAAWKVANHAWVQTMTDGEVIAEAFRIALTHKPARGAR
jgi:hypothetical protein